MTFCIITEEKSKKYQLCYAEGSYDNVSKLKEESTETSPENGTEMEKPPPTSNGKVDITDEKAELSEEKLDIPLINKFLGTIYASALLNVYFKIGVILVYFGFLSCAFYGIVTLEQGLDRANLAPDDCYFQNYFRRYTRDFLESYGPVVQVGFDKSLDYTRQSVRHDVNDVIDKFRRSKYFASDTKFVISWLDDFEIYLNNTGIDMNNITMPELISIMRNQFFYDHRYRMYYLDVDFNSDYTEIKNSRVLVQSKSLGRAVDELNMMKDARKIAEKSKYNIKVFAPPFIFYDQYDVIVKNTIENILIAIVCITLVAIIFIPSATTIVWVAMATMSICACVVGFMSLWNVSLDSVSMINLIMCIGFSVDFAAHISYHFVISELSHPNERVKEALENLGWPILQEFLSTVLAVLALAASNTYIFRTFFKLVFLVMLFGLFHAMFLLPVLLSTINCYTCRNKKTKSPAEPRSSISSIHSSTQAELGEVNIKSNIGDETESKSKVECP